MSHLLRLSIIILIICVIDQGKVFPQGGDNCVDAVANPISIPCTFLDSTLGQANDFYAGNMPNGWCVYLPNNFSAPDRLYYFCAPSTGKIQFKVYYPGLANQAPIFTIWEDCPSFDTCIGSYLSFHVSDTLAAQLSVVQGKCYMLMLDGNLGGYKYYLSAAYFSIPILSTNCTNADFELGNFNGWSGSVGEINYHPNELVAKYLPSLTGIYPSQHTIVSTGMDSCGLFPVSYPGGNFSAKLGDILPDYRKGSSLQRTIFITPTNYTYTYRFALIIDDGGHSYEAQPFFMVQFYDNNDNLIPGLGDTLVVYANNPIFQLTNLLCGMRYKVPWTAVSVDLSSYLAQNVTVKYTVGDCAYGAHCAYAYIDGACSAGPFSITENDPKPIKWRLNYLSDGSIYLNFENYYGKDARFSLIDPLGRSILRFPIDDSSIILNSEIIPSGLYLFSISMGQEKVGSGKLLLRD